MEQHYRIWMPPVAIGIGAAIIVDDINFGFQLFGFSLLIFAIFSVYLFR